jgi:hypothetical protein
MDIFAKIGLIDSSRVPGQFAPDMAMSVRTVCFSASSGILALLPESRLGLGNPFL